MSYAVAIANQFGSHITLLHSYKVYSTAGMLVSVESYLEEDAAREMLALVDEIEPQLTNGATVDSVIARGDAIPLIGSMADQYDLVVMGTQGASGLKEVFLGSITSGVIREVATPVLAVPAEAAWQIPTVMVLAMDQEGISGASVLAPLVKLGKAFSGSIKIFHQDTGADDIGIDPSVDVYLDGVPHSFYYELDDEDVNASINEFVDDIGAQLLCMVRRRRSFLEGLFHSSATQRSAFHCTVPLLVLHDDSQL